MPAPVSLVTIHHEGAGTPRNDPGGAAAGGYTYWIGTTEFVRLRDVWSSYATLGFNHVSLDICFSGMRQPNYGVPSYPVTDSDLALLYAAVNQARAAGYVTADPLVRPHKLSPGSNTVCPGDNTMARWSAVVAACTGTNPEPTPEAPMYVAVVAHGVDGYWVVRSDGAVYSFGTAKYHGGANDPAKPLNAPISGMTATPTGNGYWLLGEDGGVFAYGDAQYHGNTIGEK